MGKDKAFKEGLVVQNFVKRLDVSSLGEYYQPDVVLENNEMDTVIFFESSTTGDRKVHIGELAQFLTYLNTENEKMQNAYLVVFLCGTSSSSPTVETEFPRLRYYYKSFIMKNGERDKIKGIYIANQSKVDISNLTLESIKEFKRIDV